MVKKHSGSLQHAEDGTAVRKRRALVIVLAMPTVLLLLVGCSSRQPVPLSLSVFQYRSDLAARQAQIEVRNRGQVDVTVTSATFSSDWFAGLRSSLSTPSHVPSESTIDFPVALPPGRCSAKDPKPTVTIRYRTADGTTGTVTTTPKLPFHTIATLHAGDCSLAEFEKIARIAPPQTLRFQPIGGTRHALLDFAVTPTGGQGTVTILSSQNTTLLSQTEGELRPINLAVSAASAPTVITLDFVPSRCDAHVIGEDKVGTIIPFRVDAGPYRSAVLMIPVPKAVKSQLLDWVGAYCGL